MDKRVTDERLRGELHSMARDEGLTPAKLETSELISLVSAPSNWSPVDTTLVLCDLVADVVSDLRGEKARTAARATLNLGGSPVQGRSAMSRQAALAAKRQVHPDTVRAWWRKAARMLVEALPARITELNMAPGGWLAYQSSLARADTGPHPDYSFDRIDNAWRFHGRDATEMVTYRWLTAHRDGLDHVYARGNYFRDDSPGTYDLVPLLNCAVSATEQDRRGVQQHRIDFSEPLAQGERAFFAYKIEVRSTVEPEPYFYHLTAEGGVQLLLFRIQFDPHELPARLWTVESLSEFALTVPPPATSPRYMQTNSFGYVDQEFRDCRPRTRYGMCWEWPGS